jgi:hypothetical protein
LTSISTSFDQ